MQQKRKTPRTRLARRGAQHLSLIHIYGSAVVEVASGEEANGARYTMTITNAEGVTATYDGRLDDSWSQPYDGKMINMAFTNPLSKDWYKLHYWVPVSSSEPFTQ